MCLFAQRLYEVSNLGKNTRKSEEEIKKTVALFHLRLLFPSKRSIDLITLQNMAIPVIDAEVALECKNTLGEGELSRFMTSRGLTPSQ